MAQQGVPDLTIRSRFDEFQRMRVAARHTSPGAVHPPSESNAEPYVTVPLWAKAPDGFSEMEKKVGKKIEDLSEMHTKLLRTSFRTDDEDEILRQEIEAQTHAIQQLLLELERLVITGVRAKDMANLEEVRIVQNIKVLLSMRLQALVKRYKGVQEFYGTQVRRREQKMCKYMKIGSDKSYEMIKQEEAAAHFLKMGFQEEDLQELLIDQMRQEETSKEVKEILDSIEQINQMFCDVHTLVVDQGTILDRIDYNVDQSLIHASKAKIELEKAREKQQETCVLM